MCRYVYLYLQQYHDNITIKKKIIIIITKLVRLRNNIIIWLMY